MRVRKDRRKGRRSEARLHYARGPRKAFFGVRPNVFLLTFLDQPRHTLCSSTSLRRCYTTSSHASSTAQYGSQIDAHSGAWRSKPPKSCDPFAYRPRCSATLFGPSSNARTHHRLSHPRQLRSSRHQLQQREFRPARFGAEYSAGREHAASPQRPAPDRTVWIQQARLPATLIRRGAGRGRGGQTHACCRDALPSWAGRV